MLNCNNHWGILGNNQLQSNLIFCKTINFPRIVKIIPKIQREESIKVKANLKNLKQLIIKNKNQNNISKSNSNLKKVSFNHTKRLNKSQIKRFRKIYLKIRNRIQNK